MRSLRPRTLVLVLVVGILCTLSFFAGKIHQYINTINRDWEEQTAELQQILDGDPSYKDLRVEIRSSGPVCIVGQVESDVEKTKLRDLLIPAIGKKRTELVISPITVKGEPSR